jgi:peptidoglycan/LPS O-acetylase OafA/YrhL
LTYYRETLATISILEVAAFLAVPAGILVMSYVLPGPMYGDEDELSPEKDFARVRPVFFGVLIALVLINLVHGFAVGEQGIDTDLLFQILIVLGGVIGLSLRRQRWDNLLAVAMIVLLCVYIGIGYSDVSLAA